MFEGEYKSRPRVSLRGASKKEKRTSLIHRNQAEREKREEQRRKHNSALKIQAFVRGYWIRRHEYNVRRQEFDILIAQCQKHCDADTVHNLLRYLLYFYSEDKDTVRLINTCQLLLKFGKELKIQDYQTWIFQLRNLLRLCTSYLSTALHSKKSFATPLRILEVFTSNEWFAHMKSNRDENHDINIAVYLVKNEYFKHLRRVMEERIPKSLDIDSGTSTPLADSLIDLIMRPVMIVVQDSSSQQAGSDVLCSFAKYFFVPKISAQIKYFLLPKLQRCKMFPFQDLLQSFRKNSFLLHFGNPELLYCILTLAQTYLDSLAPHVVPIYMETILYTLRKFPPKVENTNIYEDSDSDDKSSCSSSQIMDDGQEQICDIIPNCLALLNERSHIQLLLSSTIEQRPSKPEESDENIKLLCLICNSFVIEQKSPIHETRLLLTLAFNKTFLKKLWNQIQNVSLNISMGRQCYLLQMITDGHNLRNWEAECISPLLLVFCYLFRQLLFSLHDTDFHAQNSANIEKVPFTLGQLSIVGKTLCGAILGVINIMTHEMKTSKVPSYGPASKNFPRLDDPVMENALYSKEKWKNVLEAMTNVVKQLHSRDTRLHYCPADHWLSPKINLNIDMIDLDMFFADEETLETQDILDGTSGRTFFHVAILKHIPFTIPFVDRVKLFQEILHKDKAKNGGNLQDFLMGPSLEVRIRRNSLYQDAFDELGGDQNLKQKIHVHLINAQGLKEAGVDGGGLFREFLNECLKAGFDQNIGYFSSTHEQLLYPNPQAHLVDRNVFKHYYFLGRMLGKAIYENMLVELPFASFFLCKLLSKSNADVDINHLESLDPEMYKNLLFLKNCPNVEDLALNFTVVNNNLGETQVVELKPGGRDIVVTNQNRIEYIHLMADYRLNKQIRPHSNTFRSGLSSVINISWLRMFDHNELQMLISGAQIPIDVEDLKRHTSYSGGFSEEHICIQNFWQIVSSFNDVQKSQLLRFVTSCSRPPLLGFKELYPPFTIHTAGIEDRLPSASTCVNLLKLPEYRDAETMRQKLLYSIESGSGFELS